VSAPRCIIAPSSATDRESTSSICWAEPALSKFGSGVAVGCAAAADCGAPSIAAPAANDAPTNDLRSSFELFG